MLNIGCDSQLKLIDSFGENLYVSSTSKKIVFFRIVKLHKQSFSQNHSDVA